jgi:MoaA/NifB/PqqE/SkfB family radical SAM enzyme
MSREVFGQILGLLPHAWRVTLVGLGEPTLHPEVDSLVADARARGRRVTLVTSAAALDRDKSRALLHAGLDTITFSIDAVDPELAASVRPGAPLERVLENVRGFLEAARDDSAPVETSVFCAVGATTAVHLPELVRTVVDLGVAALVLTDLNFEENREWTLRERAGPEEEEAVRVALAAGFAAGLPIFGVRAFEELGLARRFREFLLTTPAELWSRSTRHRYCRSPWQAIPVGVDGTVTACDCRPDEVAGNLLTQPFDEIWNGEVLRGLRARMRGDPAPRKCLLCPRF